MWDGVKGHTQVEKDKYGKPVSYLAAKPVSCQQQIISDFNKRSLCTVVGTETEIEISIWWLYTFFCAEWKNIPH